MDSTINQRVSMLEETLNRFILHTDKALYQLGKEMSDFKDEMSDFKEEMRLDRKESKAELHAFQQEMSDFKGEMAEFKDEMKDFKAEMRADRKEMNKKWGELSNKLGTFAEDIAAPNLPRIARTHFNVSVIKRFDKNRRASPAKSKSKHTIYEFDAMLVSPDKVLLLETKYTVRDAYLKNIPTTIKNFKACYPEYADKELIVLFASMKLHESTIKRLTRMGIYGMMMGEGTMELVNFEAVQKKKK